MDHGVGVLMRPGCSTSRFLSSSCSGHEVPPSPSPSSTNVSFPEASPESEQMPVSCFLYSLHNCEPFKTLFFNYPVSGISLQRYIYGLIQHDMANYLPLKGIYLMVYTNNELIGNLPCPAQAHFTHTFTRKECHHVCMKITHLDYFQNTKAQPGCAQ